ncbi:MAG: LamB/YcsF family protein [Gracilimonas sp.]|uniref:5-oxoprolinase subunit PxpA n=1 Tax=Gracilimonas sp. TaxID=1974203 RepID=UPI001984ACBD|nr:5-oxoprolinase subunit PxpA [Gracilimonas sp.]MBD3615115.1 LamB/YcsF family protein [Gracilimonas sp.]
MLSKIDLNCDLGEFYGLYDERRDSQIMPYISSCNIACGFHSGDPVTIANTIKLALKNKVAIGAHPSYPDLQGFGRRVMNLSAEELEACVLYQVTALKGMTESLGGKLHHVKPHGALYNHAAKDEETAIGVVKAIVRIKDDMLIYAPAKSVLREVAKDAGLKVRSEVFADRRYENDLSLRSRKLDGAVIKEKEDVLKQLAAFLDGIVYTHDGLDLPIEAETLCLHSDTEGAAELAKEIFDFLEKHDVKITSS